jgi:superfamily II DNA or RNA helicase
MITNSSTNNEKVEFFISVFRGRNDVYARRWESKDRQKSGYSPVCLNEWVAGLCEKPRVKCSDCKNRLLVSLDKQAAIRHLTGKEVAGIYPMLPDETCLFLAIDFDDEGWQKDVSAVRSICERNRIPVAVERSRSGNGAHIWMFFDEPIPAALARKLGSAVLTVAMEERHELKFKSYDRLFPNQDTMPKGGFGNLIALPLQRIPRDKGNSVFIDEQFAPYPDQWAYLSGINRMAVNEVEHYTAMLCKGSELGNLYSDEEENSDTPWQKKAPEPKLRKMDFPVELRIVEANMLYIEKKEVSQRALNRLKRLAAFENPEFYKAQAMRFPTWDKPRVISIADETEKYICLPRGCKDEITQMLEKINVSINWQDERKAGRAINVSFNGVLRNEQAVALEKLLGFDNGILSATTAFGKTVVSAALIAARKVNTLILVNRQPLLDQWKTRLKDFLIVNEDLPESESKRGRKKERDIIGQLGGGRNNLSGIIDIAIIQSLVHGDEAKDIVKNYGMVIVDECHHVSAVSFERVLREVNAWYVYGLTATPKRQDGLEPIIYMHCGVARYKDDARLQAQRRPFEHFVIPRFTSFRIPVEKDDTTLSIQELYTEICQSESRNSMIISDVFEAVSEGRNILILTERKSHVELLESALKDKLPNVITFVGGGSKKESKILLETVSSTPADQPLVIVATGKYVGEGFDVPRLDTLFLAMPIAWEGTLAQYAGRLHRLYEDKREVRVYDYIDVRVAVFDRMYAKRVKGYSSIGYQTKSDVNLPDNGNIIFDCANFLPVFTADLLSAKREVLIVSPFVKMNRTERMLQTLDIVLSSGTKVTIVTRPANEYNANDQDVAQVINMLREHSIIVIERSRIHQKFAVIDRRTTWYGSINLLSFGNAEESIMRLESKGISEELLKIEQQNNPFGSISRTKS